jgi:hypothetical protein
MGSTINFRSTKFLQTSGVLLVNFVALGYGWIDATVYATVTLGALTNYAYHDVKQKGKEYAQ